MTREEAVKLAESKWYETQTAEEIVAFQLYIAEAVLFLCPFIGEE